MKLIIELSLWLALVCWLMKTRMPRRPNQHIHNPCPHGWLDWDDCPVCCH